MTDSAPEPRPLILGTAGHIDHGKSTLIEALTGTDPDRLAEEKRRGITIELGFARLSLPDGTYLGVVDVPGHERFVRQMIAGATGIDLALLCIAADDGIMPQTREHLAVLQLLGIRECVVALTKCDLVDGEWVEMAVEEVRAGLVSTLYADADIVPVSARTGEGLDELREVLASHAAALRTQGKEGPARLPIDRVFTIKGAGTVVTGTLWRGEVRPGDELEAFPSRAVCRVRTVQVHDREVPCSVAGMRTALNLVGVKTDELRPGDFLAAQGTLEPSDRFDADFTYLPTGASTKPLASGTRLHVAHGTREVVGRILFMDGRESLEAGASAWAQIRLDEPLPLSRNDRFVVRSYSPVRVVGGGAVLSAHPRRRTNLKPTDRALLEALSRDDEPAAVRAAVDACDAPVGMDELARATGLSRARAEELACALAGGASAGGYELLEAGGARLVARASVVQRHVGAIENLLLGFHAKNPTATGMSTGALRQLYPHRVDDACFEALLARAQDAGKAVVDGGEVSHPRAGAGARALEAQAAEALLAALRSHGTKPPELPELFAEASVDEKRGGKALAALEADGRARRVGKTYCFCAEALDELWGACRDYLHEHGQATAAELKEAMGTSRKYAIPLLEHFDAVQATMRQGDVRILAREEL